MVLALVDESAFVQRFGHLATRNVYSLSEAQAQAYLRAEPVETAAVDDGRGWAVARWGSMPQAR